MEILARVLFCLGALAAAGGLLVLVVLSPRPQRLEDHLLGLARYLMFAGALIGATRVLYGWQPGWDQVLFMAGFGLGMAIFARRNHLLALAEEMRTEGEESGA